MKRNAFQRWMGRVGLAAMLLLVLVPTTARVVHATAAGNVPAQAQGHAHAGHAGAAAHVHHGGRERGDTRAAIGDPDCDYCPLLASLVAATGFAFDVAHVPVGTAATAVPPAPRLPWRHPAGLGSRGPPQHG